jgi:hypothetical protein
MGLHIGYEQVAPFALTRTDTPDDKARAAGLSPKAMLRADPEAGSITLDSETTLRGIPADAWLYKLGNRSALDWVLDQYKEKKPKDPTIREQFDTYRFAEYKEKVIDLLMRVTTVSVETVRMTQAMRTVLPRSACRSAAAQSPKRTMWPRVGPGFSRMARAAASTRRYWPRASARAVSHAAPSRRSSGVRR